MRYRPRPWWQDCQESRLHRRWSRGRSRMRCLRLLGYCLDNRRKWFSSLFGLCRMLLGMMLRGGGRGGRGGRMGSVSFWIEFEGNLMESEVYSLELGLIWKIDTAQCFCDDEMDIRRATMKVALYMIEQFFIKLCWIQPLSILSIKFTPWKTHNHDGTWIMND